MIDQLVELQRKRSEFLKRDGIRMADDLFDIEQNARVVRNAEEYYRTMMSGEVSSWNLRDRHMVETLTLLRKHLQKGAVPPKIVVWAHNSHLGDARFTEMGERGEWNVGELLRKGFPSKTFLLGFTTYSGTVTAASDWDSIAENKRIRPGLPESYEDIFHRTGIDRFVLNFRGGDLLSRALQGPRLERAIGVLYRPDSERRSHYFYANLSRQFDAVFHMDVTRAVEPLEKTGLWLDGEALETYPSAM